MFPDLANFDDKTPYLADELLLDVTEVFRRYMCAFFRESRQRQALRGA